VGFSPGAILSDHTASSNPTRQALPNSYKLAAQTAR
jgi:hypothetical protein